MGTFDEKNGGGKSHATVPLNQVPHDTILLHCAIPTLGYYSYVIGQTFTVRIDIRLGQQPGPRPG